LPRVVGAPRASRPAAEPLMELGRQNPLKLKASCYVHTKERRGKELRI